MPRAFNDAEGRPWTVREIDAHRLPNARGDRALLFESDGGWRICWAYPADWSSLSGDALEALSLKCRG